MDGWRKPKRKAVDPPATFEAPEPETCGGGRESRRASRGDALPAEAAPSAETFANGDLAPMLARLREDLESMKRFFAGSADPRRARGGGDFVRAPDETERKLLHTQDALLSATEKVRMARAERDAARADTARAEEARARSDEAFSRAADAEARANAQRDSARRELAGYKAATNAHHAANATTNATNGTNATNDDGTNTLTDTRLRLERAERRAEASRLESETASTRLAEKSAEARALSKRFEDASREHAAREAVHEQRMREVLEATETKTHELSTALAKALNAARESQASDLKTSRALATALAERDAARAERDARKVALDGFADAARDADSRCVALLADLKKAQNDASRAKAALEERARIARGADDAAARAAEETRRFKSENATLASRLARVAAATRAVDDAAAHVRAVARGDASPENDDDAGDEGNKGDVSGFDRDAAAERRNVESVVAFPASLAESLGNPSRVPRSPRRHAAAAADEDAPSTEPGGDPFAESVPASAEAAPVTAPVPRRRGERLRRIPRR